MEKPAAPTPSAPRAPSSPLSASKVGAPEIKKPSSPAGPSPSAPPAPDSVASPAKGNVATAAPSGPKPVSSAAPAETAVAKAASSVLASVNANATVSAVSNKLNGFFGENKVKAIMYLLVSIAGFALMALIIYVLVNKTVNQRTSYKLPETDFPIMGTKITSILADQVPISKNGKRQTVSFWIYIHDLDKYRGQYRHVWHRGDLADLWEKGSPAVYLDKDSNKLFFTIGTEKTDPYNGLMNGANTTGMNDAKLKDQKYAVIRTLRGITIDYIPLQRWVHVAVVINEDVNNGNMTAYVDGELTTVVNTEKTVKLELGKNSANRARYVYPKLSIHNSNLNKRGNVHIGGSPADEMGPGFSGMVSRINFFNYDLNAKDIYNEYRKGPVSTVAGKIGYGVRTPVYRVG